MSKVINQELCIGCGACAIECVFNAITLEGRPDGVFASVDQQKCVECDICVPICPLGIIEHDAETPERRRFTRIEIVEEKCIGCSLCKKACPVGAISGVIKQPFTIDQEKCIKCGVCMTKCRKDAFDAEYSA